MIVVVMGVCGVGKTSVGKALAERTGWAFIEGDDLHSEASRQKMAAGIALDDDDRWPWLDRIAEMARARETEAGSVVVACSALKRAYRDRLRGENRDVRFLHLVGDPSVIHARMTARVDHYMPAGLLQSQLATLEVPEADETAVTFDITEAPEAIAARAEAALKPDGTAKA